MGKGKALAELRLSERQKGLLEQHMARRSTAAYEGSRIAIILGAFSGQSNSDLARHLAVNYKKVARWRNRWIAWQEKLCHFEQGVQGQGVSDRELLNKMLSLLRDAPRPGAPKVITLEQEQQIRALACRKPKDFGVPLTSWTHELLAMIAERKGLVDKISPRYVGVLLKKAEAPTP